jgi:hypothetical protein
MEGPGPNMSRLGGAIRFVAVVDIIFFKLTSLKQK